MNKAKPCDFSRWLASVVLLSLGVCQLCLVRADSITEPATVFFGKVFGTGSGQAFQVTQGAMEWVIHKADGKDLILQTTLFPLHDGEFSYRLDVPHEAVALGLQPSSGTVGLAADAQKQELIRITIEGHAARIAGPNGSTFDALQVRRASTYRLDLEVALKAEDKDGDGIPDWWAAKYGLNKSKGNDPDGDGVSNLQEYRRGLNPTHDDRQPTLATDQVVAYEGTTGLLLQTKDIDSAPADLVYTLTKAPTVGTLALRNARENPASPDSQLDAGSQFTQADVQNGRLVFSSDGTGSSTSFELSVRDEDPAHPAATGTVKVDFYKPSTELLNSKSTEAWIAFARDNGSVAGLSEREESQLRNYILSKELGFIVWDGSAGNADQTLSAASSLLTQNSALYISKFGAERSHFISGGLGSDQLTGGLAADILVAGAGNDVLRGNGGSDQFRFVPTTRKATVADFSLEDHDVLDLSRVLDGTSRSLKDYLQLSAKGNDAVLRVNAHAAPNGATDLEVTLTGLALANLNIDQLAEEGLLYPGLLQLMPSITIWASKADASENGPEPGEFLLRRSGSLETDLNVNLSIGGSAVNGVDYSRIDETVHFAPGMATATVAIQPFADSLPEPDEVVELTVLAGNDYEVGHANRAAITIEDLQILVTISAVEPLAVKDPITPGALMIKRSGVIDRSVVVRLDVGGSAARGTDYQSLVRFVNLSPGQTSLLLPVLPLPGAVLEAGTETIEVSLVPDDAYKIGPGAGARIILVQRDNTLAAWRARHFADLTGSLAVFAAGDPGGMRISNLARYAFDLDATRPDRGGLPKAAVRDGYLTVEFGQRTDASDLDYIIESSSDLLTWESLQDKLEKIAPSHQAPDLNLVCYRLVPGMKGQNKTFLRVRVVLKP